MLSDRSADAALVVGIQNFAKYIELQLIGGGVAYAYWLGPGIAGEPGNLPFSKAPFAREPVHDLELRGTARDRAPEPGPPIGGLMIEAGIDQREQGECCIPQLD